MPEDSNNLLKTPFRIPKKMAKKILNLEEENRQLHQELHIFHQMLEGMKEGIAIRIADLEAEILSLNDKALYLNKELTRKL